MLGLYNGSLAIRAQFIIYMVFLLATALLFYAGIDIGRKPGCEIIVFRFGTYTTGPGGL